MKTTDNIRKSKKVVIRVTFKHYPKNTLEELIQENLDELDHLLVANADTAKELIEEQVYEAHTDIRSAAGSKDLKEPVYTTGSGGVSNTYEIPGLISLEIIKLNFII